MFELSSDSQGREMPGAGLFHLIARRQDGELLFPLDGDRHHFWEAIGEHSVDFGWILHGYCMTHNFAHLLVEADEQAIEGVTYRLSREIQKRISRSARNGAPPMEITWSSKHFEELSSFILQLRYIHLCPVRAQMVKVPEHYYWSSHRTYLGDRQRHWLATDLVLGVFGQVGNGGALAEYKRFIDDGLATDSVEATWSVASSESMATHIGS